MWNCCHDKTNKLPCEVVLPKQQVCDVITTSLTAVLPCQWKLCHMISLPWQQTIVALCCPNKQCIQTNKSVVLITIHQFPKWQLCAVCVSTRHRHLLPLKQQPQTKYSHHNYTASGIRHYLSRANPIPPTTSHLVQRCGSQTTGKSELELSHIFSVLISQNVVYIISLLYLFSTFHPTVPTILSTWSVYSHPESCPHSCTLP